MGAKRDGRKRNLLWLLVIVAVVVVWWLWRPAGDRNLAAASPDDVADGDPDDVLVDLVDDASDADVATIERDLGIQLVLVSKQAKDERFYRAHVPAASRDALLSALQRRPEVETAEPDAEVQLFDAPGGDGALRGPPNDPLYKHQWHLRQIGMPDAWRLATGKGVTVAVIDTGVAYEDFGRFHRVPDLAKTKLAKGYNFVDDNEHANDDHGHGTHVAGTIAQSTNNGIGVAGVAPGATIMPLKVLSASGSGSVAAIADAIRFAADNGAKVINMSLGGRFRSRVLERAVRYAADKGVVVVCAAGNDGRGKVSFPAAYPGAIAVAATQFDESTTFYSNWGKEIDIAAPGGNTKVDQDKDGRPDGVLQNTIVVGDPTKDDYLGFMGTSMASPHVAGVAALVVSQGVTDPDSVEKILVTSARAPHHGTLDRQRYGGGIVDAPAALRKARGQTGAWQLALGVLCAAAAARGTRRRLGASFGAAVVLGASGLFFVPLLGSVGAWLQDHPLAGLAASGFPSWDLALLGVGGHGNPLFFSATVPLAAVLLLYGVRVLRPALAGFALGVAGHLAFFAAAPLVNVRWMPLDAAWLLANALLCVGIGSLALRE